MDTKAGYDEKRPDFKIESREVLYILRASRQLLFDPSTYAAATELAERVNKRFENQRISPDQITFLLKHIESEGLTDKDFFN